MHCISVGCGNFVFGYINRNKTKGVFMSGQSNPLYNTNYLSAHAKFYSQYNYMLTNPTSYYTGPTIVTNTCFPYTRGAVVGFCFENLIGAAKGIVTSTGNRPVANIYSAFSSLWYAQTTGLQAYTFNNPDVSNVGAYNYYTTMINLSRAVAYLSAALAGDQNFNGGLYSEVGVNNLSTTSFYSNVAYLGIINVIQQITQLQAQLSASGSNLPAGSNILSQIPTIAFALNLAVTSLFSNPNRN
jgi:hypothetical protein